MPNFARILVNILLYILYVVVIAFLLGVIIPLILVSLGRPIPIYTPEVYNLIFFIIAGLVLLLTLMFRRSCYLGLKGDETVYVTQTSSYTQKKKLETYNGEQSKQTSSQSEKQLKKTHEETVKNKKNTPENDKIKIYVEKEIQ